MQFSMEGRDGVMDIRKSKKLFTPNVNIWLEVKASIEMKIITGEYEAAERLPSISQVAELFNCSSTTAQKVLEALLDEGILIKKHGVGYFLKPFVKNKLLESHKDMLKLRISEVIDYGSRLGMDKEKILELIEEVYFDQGSSP